jgi:ATP-dependent DNA ligase I
VLLSEIAKVSRVVATTSARLAKIEALAGALREAGPLEVPIAVAYLSGELPQRQIGVGWAALRGGFPPADAPTLTLSEVDAGFSAIGAVSGKGSTAARRALVGELFGRATADEQRFLVGLLSGELRQGALEGVMTEAVARAAAVPVAEVRRAVMLRGSLGVVAAAALGGGSAALAAFGLEVGRPLRPMLASSATSIDEALARAGVPAAVEWKLDGVRIQAHLSGGDVRLFTRTLDDITARLPDVVAVLAKLPLSAAVLDGELIALREDGRPLPFQDTAARAATQAAGPAVPLSVFLFDALHLEGADLIDSGDQERHRALARVVPEDLLMPRLVTASAEEAAAFFADALAHGHEGVVIKSLSTPYTAGRRGAGWIKVKPRHTLDLVVLAVEWGHGRRRGWLSNLHLGARDPATGGFVMLGKTFKGLTDELLTWQTARLLALEDGRDAYTVYVRPELVVEIAFDGVQRSPRYPGGLALRFARVLRYREDKTAAEADTIDTVRALSPELGPALGPDRAPRRYFFLRPLPPPRNAAGMLPWAWGGKFSPCGILDSCSARLSAVRPSGRPPSPPRLPSPPAPCPGPLGAWSGWAWTPPPRASSAARRGSPLRGAFFLPFLRADLLARRAAGPMPGIAGMPGMPPLNIAFICFWPSKKFVTSCATSPTATPEPLAMRDRREPLMILGLRRSSGVMDRTMASARSRSLSLTCSISSRCFPAPGSMPRIFPIGPSLRTMDSCSTKSSSVKPSPEASRPASVAVCSASKFFSACSIRVRMSPRSRIRDAIRSGWNRSKSSSFSPAEANMIGRPVSCTMDSAAPPRASPSSLVSTTPS